jgi:hypothetical protein
MSGFQIKVIGRPSFATPIEGVCFIFYVLPLHVSALPGHLQVEYNIILGSYLTTIVYSS